MYSHSEPPGKPYATTLARVGGERVLVVMPSIPDDAPPEVREGLARRAIVNAGGTCPCGARLELPNRAERRAAKRRGETLHAAVYHEDDCPATDEQLAARIRWGRP